jgi:hypothetical protein
MERELRENMIGEEAWRGLEPMARARSSPLRRV